jgi:tRNA(fMet)-specific endonuclease VapC
MPVFLLDTNAFSELLRDPTGSVAGVYRRKEADPDARLMTSIIVACEARYGAVKKGSPPLSKRIDRLLASMDIAPLSPGVDHAYANLRADLERRGLVIGQNDMLIAAHALALDAVLVTDNVSEFKRVKGLRLENWRRR